MQLNYSPKIALITLDSEFKTITIGRHCIHMQQTENFYFVDVYRGSNVTPPILTISVTDFGYTEMIMPDGSYTWIFNTDTHPLQVSVGSNDITTSTLSKSHMLVTFKPTYRGVTDEVATAIMRKILYSAHMQGVAMPSVKYARYGEFQFYLEEGEGDLQLYRMEALVRKINSDATLRDELDICNLEVEYL